MTLELNAHTVTTFMNVKQPAYSNMSNILKVVGNPYWINESLVHLVFENLISLCLNF